MRDRINRLLLNFLKKLNEELLNSSIKVKFNFSYKENSYNLDLTEEFSTELKFNNQLVKVSLYRIYFSDRIDYDISINNESFNGYISTQVKLKIQSTIENIEKFSAEFISEYPSSIQFLMDIYNSDSLSESELNDKSERLQSWTVYFSSNIDFKD